MRIALLTIEYITEISGAGGLASYLARLGQVLVGLGHEVEVFVVSAAEPAELCYKGVLVHRVRPQENLAIRAARRVCGCLPLRLNITLAFLRGASGIASALAQRERTRPFDLVQSADYGFPGLFVPSRPWRRHVVRCSWASDLFTESADGHALDFALISRLERRAMRNADFAYAPSCYVAEHYRRRHRIRMSVIRPPFLLDAQPQDQGLPSLPGRYMLHFGWMGPRKGTDVLAAALPLVWAQEPAFTMVWAGQEDQRQPQYLLSWGADASKVIRLGRLAKPQMYAVIRSAEAAVLPSRYDNLPNAAIESLMFGVPVIGTRGASIDELVEDGVSGILVPIGDHRALAEAMLRVWRRQVPWTRGTLARPAILGDMAPARAAQNLLDLGGTRAA